MDYVRGLYSVLQRLRAKCPRVPMMLCSGGGGRADYELLKYFTKFWPSNDTELLERIFMQWNYSYFFPAIVSDNHMADWGKRPLKYRLDVASMGKLGFDIVYSKLSDKDKQFAQAALHTYNGFKDVVWHGEQYRLASPYEGDIAALLYVNADKSRAIVFTLPYRHAPEKYRYPAPGAPGRPRPAKKLPHYGAEPVPRYQVYLASQQGVQR